MTYRLAADIGGTFTDVVLADDETGQYSTTKVLTTPASLTLGIVEGFEQVVEGQYQQVRSVVHGTTAGLNAVLERKGARSALLTTRGFRDVYEIGRGNRPDMYNIRFRKPQPLIPRSDVFEVDERTRADGRIELPVQEASLSAVLEQIKGRYSAVAVCFLNSYINPANEWEAAAWLRSRLGDNVLVLTSHETAREWREYERTSTTVLNAYVAPIMKAYLSDLGAELRERGFKGTLYIMQSSGGVITADLAVDRAVQTLMSGPVGGAIGASAIGQSCGRSKVIGIDMGGTSFDVSLVVDGRVETTVESSIEGFPVLVPTVNIYSIGAGGGSIAWSEAGGMRVGPQSAGARPGPVCYGKGGIEPTITDANVVLGRLDPEHFLGGRMRIDAEAANRVIEEYGRAFGLDRMAAAEGICAIANHKMADAIREITVRRGIDPREYTLLAFGGAGPMHAAFIAEELDIDEVVVPTVPGAFSAWGMLQADIRHDAVRTLRVPTRDLHADDVARAFRSMTEELTGLLTEEGVALPNTLFHRSADMRYLGQEYTVPVLLPDGDGFSREQVEAAFHNVHQQRYGHSNPGEDVELVNLRLTAVGLTKKASLARESVPPDRGEPPVLHDFPGVFDGHPHTVRVYTRSSLSPGNTVAGPAVVVELTATTVVPPRWSLRVDEFGNLVLTRVGL